MEIIRIRDSGSDHLGGEGGRGGGVEGGREGEEGGGRGAAEGKPAVSQGFGCFHVILWLVGLLTYLLETGGIIAVSVLYLVLVGNVTAFILSIVFLVVPSVIVMATSLIWLYDFDRYYRVRVYDLRRSRACYHGNSSSQRRQEERRRSSATANGSSSTKFNVGTVFVHTLLLGLVYRCVCI